MIVFFSNEDLLPLFGEDVATEAIFYQNFELKKVFLPWPRGCMGALATILQSLVPLFHTLHSLFGHGRLLLGPR